MLVTRAILGADIALPLAGPPLGRFPESTGEIAERLLTPRRSRRDLTGLEIKAANKEPLQP
jgi:hypothetical protein